MTTTTTTTTKIIIEMPAGLARKPLFKQYPTAHKPQRAWVQLDPESGVLSAGFSGDDLTPEAVFYRRLLRFHVDPTIGRGDLRDLLMELRRLAKEIVAGYSTSWNGTDLVGTYSGRAEDAIDAIDDICSDTFED